MRELPVVLASAVLLLGAVPASALPVGRLAAPADVGITYVGGPCKIGYNFDRFRGLCRPARFGFGRAYRPFVGCVIRDTPYGPRRFCR